MSEPKICSPRCHGLVRALDLNTGASRRCCMDHFVYLDEKVIVDTAVPLKCDACRTAEEKIIAKAEERRERRREKRRIKG